MRGIIDVAAPKKLTGQVLWKQVWRKTSGGEDRPSVPWLYHLAVDDGSRDRTRAWGAPASLSSADAGDTVTVTVHRWSRRVMALSVDQHAPSAYASSASSESTSDAAADPEKLVAGLLGGPAGSVLGGPLGLLGGVLRGPAEAGHLLTVDEVTAALGLPVTLDSAGVPGPLPSVFFRTADRKKAVLMLQVASGPLGAMAWRSNSRGESLPSIGDGAWVRGNRAVAKSGESIVVLTLMSAAKGRSAGLSTLLSQAVARIPSQRPPSS